MTADGNVNRLHPLRHRVARGIALASCAIQSSIRNSLFIPFSETFFDAGQPGIGLSLLQRIINQGACA
jgi:hypothetical protein